MGSSYYKSTIGVFIKSRVFLILLLGICSCTEYKHEVQGQLDVVAPFSLAADRYLQKGAHPATVSFKDEETLVLNIDQGSYLFSLPRPFELEDLAEEELPVEEDDYPCRTLNISFTDPETNAELANFTGVIKVKDGTVGTEL